MTLTCEGCGQPFDASRKTARFCGSTCRQRVHRNPSSAGVSKFPAPASRPLLSVTGNLVEKTRSELEAAGRADTMLGQLALSLAERLQVPDTGSATAALSKELRATMAAALANSSEAGDPVDEVGRRREAKLARATAG